jgi:hypothetical protein
MIYELLTEMQSAPTEICQTVLIHVFKHYQVELLRYIKDEVGNQISEGNRDGNIELIYDMLLQELWHKEHVKVQVKDL